MCGIAGFVNLDGAPADARVLAAMTAMLRHRGPDDRGTLCLPLRGAVPDVALGCQRLKIVDLSNRGRQPMGNADASIAMLLNGEVYDALDYRPGLERDGYHFRSGTDTEVVLALYQRDGLERTLEQIDGMFAIVIADRRRGVVHLVRDRVGIKPLYWTRRGDALLFASEAKAFLAHPAFRADIDAGAIDELLAFRYVSGPDTLLTGVRQVAPGHCLTITPDGLAETRYWSIPDRAEKMPPVVADATDRLDDLLDRSVRAQLRSDVSVGCQLSGGVDSSLVTALASSHRGGLDAFSIVFDDPRFSEEPWIAAAAGPSHAASYRVVFDEAAFVDALDAASWHMDQPIGHPNALALWCLARRARERVTVLLTGEGADELFAGYARFARALTGDELIRASQFHSQARLAKLRPGADLTSALAKRRAVFADGHADHLSNCVKYEMRTHLGEVLLRQDKMMMAHGIEARVPFLDRRVMEFARALAPECLMAKLVVKDLAARRFGAAFASRPKFTFNLPLAQYFRGATFVSLMEDRLLPGMASRGLVDVAVVRRWWRRALSAPSTTEAFWIVVALELWAQQFVDGAGSRLSPPT
jgi:asparagine synthase (glutamine-hydrolysing)